ncbi:hypothetical protein P2H44_06605 [Albimonas sp. CAU 1670]|uniref:hypothetical protein n=1 Tax=Albimonas sp. CAU 1670 TaxID=3032599 RepID=UPI0023DB8526|nr:hypothetical protein [Albimonas sp. CAU 1670]MDF2232221.1 hypothetical protein [Albimonas sp. CAU 1670]
MSAPASGPVAALRRLGAMGALSGLTLGGVMVQAAPMGPLPDAPMPDLAWCVLAFFVLRRPAAAPLGLVALLLVMRDALLGGPLGAGALSLLLASEALRWRAKELPPPRSVWGDWVWASLGYASALGLQWLLMAISLGHPPALLALGPHLGATVLAIPVVAGILRYGMRIGASPRQDEEGRRLPARRLPPRRLGKGAS